VLLKCLGDQAGPGFQGYLDGRTQDASVGLAPTWAPPFSGTRWAAADDGAGNVTLKCMGAAPGLGFQGFLDGRTLDGSVGLAQATAPPFTGTHWQVVDLGAVEVQAFDTGWLSTGIAVGGDAHIVVRNNGDWTVNSHAHDSGFDNIDYTISVVLTTPSAIAITFQHSGHTEGTIAGLPFGTPRRDDDFVGNGNNPQIAAEWPGVIGATLNARIDGTDTIVQGAEGLLGDMVKSAAEAAGAAAAKAVIALL
jgi:hypothetical protein